MTIKDENTQKVIQTVKNNLRNSLSQINANSSVGAIRYAAGTILEDMTKQGMINGYSISIDPTKHMIDLTIKPVLPINSIITTFDLSAREISFEVAAVISNEDDDDQWQK